MPGKISPKFHVKTGVKNGKFHANFTLLGRSAEKTLTSLNKESRPFFLGDKGIWSSPYIFSLSDYSTWRS